jgi:DNA-binding transcriptional LysR family regulator
MLRSQTVSIQNLDLNLLVVLDAVLAERSVARAARRLHVTPSAVSNALARLREALGDPLFARSGRGIAPTPRALELAPALARALRDLHAAVTGDGFDPRSTSRQFTLAIADLGQLAFVPRLARLLAKEMPRARLRVVGIDVMVASGGLAGTEVDVAVAMAQKSPGLHALPLYSEELVLTVAGGNRRVARSWSKAALEAVRHVDVQVVPGTSAVALTAAFTRAGVTRDVAVVTPTFMAAAAVVATTEHVAALPERLLELVRPILGLQRIRSVLPPVVVDIHLVWHERTHRDPAMAVFRELCRRAVRPEARAPRPITANRAASG